MRFPRMGFAVLFFLLATIFTPRIQAQTNFLIGATGGDVYSNVYGGLVGRVEVPFAKRLELDIDGELSPRISLNGYTINLEKKLNLGTGFGYTVGTTGRVYFTHAWALDGGIEESAYSVTATSKAQYFTKGGFTYRRIWLGVPTRFTFDYIREVANGIQSNGDESSHLQGGSVTIEGRLGCASVMCFRMSTNIQGGRVLQQGNPVCDGTFGTTGGPNGGPCPRAASTSGGASMSLYLEFPRRKATENNPF